ncbi:GFA family protein [Noviherbaspirillum cavernae]|uniref:GFA family protein n=1 Tax=Noviherbaspirillum cavernae TaxID=2320862 RepID=A0A418WX20_9BURK|nr:GFA family protein [Noviherbaspirillum cavernae]RJG04786.1 GFA family protein [Noviherbaspirillum cavernae]
MIHGSCLCGGVQYDYAGEFGTITVCHCSDCRKAQGTSTVVAAPVNAAQFRWRKGSELIAEYESSPGKKRAFCRRCGAPLYSRRDDAPEVLRLRMGTIDNAVDATPVAHIFTANVPAWAAMDDELPRYDGQEPGRG